MMGHNVCCVDGCGNTESHHPGKVFYAFPKEPWRSKWLRRIRRPDLKDALSPEDRVCSDHFTSNQYNAKRALLPDALPSIPYQDEDETTKTAKMPELKRTTLQQNEIHRKKHRLANTQAIQSTIEENIIEIHIKKEPNTEELTTNDSAGLSAEECILNIKEEPLSIETQCQDNDPLAIVKTEPGVFTVATQTFSRKDLYMSVASCTGVEQLDLASGINVQKKTLPAQTQTSVSLLTYFTNETKKKMKAEIAATKRRTRIFSKQAMDRHKFMKFCDSYLNEKIALIVKTHSHIQENYVGNRYGHDLKVFAINLSLSNPESYGFVEQIFNLPSRTTLRRLQMPARTGTNQNLIEYLKVKVSTMTEKEKTCAMCLDVMRVSNNLWYEVANDFLCGMQEIDQVLGPEPAEYAAVLMIRGLYTKWTQPVSFAFMTEKRHYPELKEWLHKILGMMFDIGLNIKALVAELDNDFLDMSLPNGEYYFEIDGRKIYHFYDMRYLFKSARDTFMKCNFHIGSKTAQWSHIVKVFDKDREHDLSLIPNITDAHIRPSEEARNDLNLAIQVFSTPVAAAMNFHVISNMGNQKMKDTVEFITKMSNLFDILAAKTLASAYKGTEQQNQVLTDGLEYLEALEVKNKHKKPIEAQFVTGLKVNIRSAVSLLEELKEDNLQYLVTKVLSKDCVEAYFDACRKLGGNCCETPSPIMFARSFRRLFLVNLVNTDDDNEQDLKSMLYKIGEYMKSDAEKKEEPECTFLRIKRILGPGVGDIKIQWPSLEYIAGYLIWKCLERHPCKKFIEKLSTHYDIPVEENAATLLENFRKYNADNVNSIYLLKPPEFLVEFVNLMDQKYCEYYTKPDREPIHFCWNTYLFMESDTFELPCECFPLQYMKILFIRLKTEHSVRGHNKDSKNPRKPKHMQRKKMLKKVNKYN